MGNNVQYIPALMVSLIIAYHSDAQELRDSLIYKTETEETDSTSGIIKGFSDVTRQMQEEKTLIKLGINELIFPDNPENEENETNNRLTSAMVGLGIEQKLKESWSFLVEWRTYYERFSLYDSPTNNYHQTFNLHEFDIGTKYYYNMKNRISIGDCANNFSSNYLILKYSHRLYINDTYRYLWRDDRDIQSRIIFGYGIQRRLTNFGFFDMHFGSAVNIYREHAYHPLPVSIPLGKKVGLNMLHFGFNLGFGL